MRKVTTIVTFLLIFALMMAPGVNVMAGSINEYEAELLEFGSSVFTYNGVDYIATEEAKERARNYLMQNDVNLSAAQAEEARSEFYANLGTAIADGYMVPVETPSQEPSGGNSSGGSSSGGDTSTVVPETTVTPETETETKVETETGTETETEVETETETEMSETEQVTENTEGVATEAEIEVETETETETELEEVTLREKNFKKGLDVTTVAIIAGGVVLGVAIVIVLSHKNRRYRK